MQKSLPATPLTGNPVITTTVIVTLVAGVIKLLRSYGVDVTGDQENAILELLRGPAGDWIVVVVFFLSQAVNWQNVYSRLSVHNLTGRVDPPVPAIPPAPLPKP